VSWIGQTGGHGMDRINTAVFVRLGLVRFGTARGQDRQGRLGWDWKGKTMQSWRGADGRNGEAGIGEAAKAWSSRDGEER
jgi:hypothetical protein